MTTTADRIDRLKRTLTERLRRERRDVAPAAIRVVRAPYRVCPLGAHIDHQLGPVTALALDQSALLAFAPTDDGRVELQSLDFPGDVSFAIDQVEDRRPGDWGNFPRGAVRALQARHRLRRGVVGVISGSLHGGGVSSSAAVGVACLLALEHANDLSVDAWENIRLDQAIENDYLGLRNGILDQAAILLSRRGALTRIDCAALRHDVVFPGANLRSFKILLAFSGLRQALVGTNYNRRVDECAAAARILLDAAGRPSDRTVLGNVSPEEYRLHAGRLDGPPALRAKHFFSELDRVGQGIEAWRAGDLARFGRLMTESGESSIVSYECGSPPLIDLYHILAETDGVLGTRFSGAGFRGCCVALVDPDQVDAAARAVRDRYSRRRPDLAADADVVVCDSADHAGLVESDA